MFFIPDLLSIFGTIVMCFGIIFTKFEISSAESTFEIARYRIFGYLKMNGIILYLEHDAVYTFGKNAD